MSGHEPTGFLPPPAGTSPDQPPAPAALPAKPSLIARVASSRVFLVIALLVGMAMGGAAKAGSAGTASNEGPAPTMAVTTPAFTASPAPTMTMTAIVTVTEAPGGAPAAISADGVYLVGTEIEPGTYQSDGGEGCYWARLYDVTGGVDSSADNGLGGGQQVVTIRAGDAAFETVDCGAWTKIK